MGEVFRARDTRLDRSVAIKVLPSAYSNDAQLKTRFEREAKAISQLSHPNICALYDVGNQDGVEYLVMELLEGHTLAGPLPLADVVKYGVQIAEALEKAHRNGIVHRDLKPQNIMITKTGAKLLDFGLAKTAAVDVGAEGPTAQQITREGTIVGTFHYMSPEQLEGLPVDARSDIFALGAVLYEMVTGNRAFSGKTKTSVIAAIVAADPPPILDAPPPFQDLIRACLAKDPDARMQSAHDVALQLRSIEKWGAASPGRKRNWLPWLISLALAASLIAVLLTRQRPQSQPLQFTIESPPNTSIDGPPAISPDGRRLVFRTIAADHSRLLWMRSLDSVTAQPLKGTEGVSFAFWSQDGKNVGFTARGKLWRLDPADGSVRTIYEPVEFPPGGATWNRDGVVIVAPQTEGTLWRVPASGGTATMIPGTAKQVAYWPSFLPDGDHFLYNREYAGKESGIYVGSLTSNNTKRVLPSDASFNTSRSTYAAGNLYYERSVSLYRIPFDVKKLETRGEPVKIEDNVEFPAPGRAAFSVSDEGTIVYRKSGPAIVGQMTIINRGGHALGTVGDLLPYGHFALSPDETRIAYARDEEISTISILDRARGTSSRAVLELWAANSAWFSDNRSLFYSAAADGPPNVYVRRAGAPSELLLKSDRQSWATSVTPDGKYGIYDFDDPKTTFDIYAIPIAPPHTPIPIVKSPARERDGKISPDGKWIVYVSDESGQQEIYAATFPDAKSRVQISNSGGVTPHWSRDGRELYYLQTESKRLMAVKVTFSNGELRPAVPEPLFLIPSGLFDGSRDGSFIVSQERINSESPGLTVLMK